LLRYRKTGLLIAIVVANHDRDTVSSPCWCIEASKTEQKRTAIIAFLDQPNKTIESLRVFKKLCFSRFTIHPGRADEWLHSGHPLNNIPDFLKIFGGDESQVKVLM
jgi:hypothetical protein